MAKTLYICYFGLREPLVQTQVLPYLRELKKFNRFQFVDLDESDKSKFTGELDVSILTFEPDFKTKWTDEEIKNERAKLAAE